MLSFRSIIFAAAALATFVSAIPTPDTTGGATGGLTNLVGGAGGVPAIPNLTGGGLPTKRGDDKKSCGDIIKKGHDDIAVIVIEIGSACKGKDGKGKDVDHDLVISLLWDIVAVLEGILHDLKLIIKVELLLNGVVCTVKELACVVADLLIIVIELVWLILSIVGFLDFTLCGVIATIGELLCEILTLVCKLVGGLLVEIVILIEPYGDHCKYVKYTDILVFLGIKL